MHHPIFGHVFAVLVAPILLLGLAFYIPNKKKASVRKKVEDSNTGASGSLTAPTGTSFGGSGSSPTETKTTLTGNHYEVFLSFRGSDTRDGFADHLYNGLVDAGICAFRDDEELRQGEEIGPDLFAAIKNSKILIPILSVNYGSSKWCLDELVQIVECKNDNAGIIVLPIFYKVEPADVRYQKGSFGNAFHTREKYFDPMTLEKWKQALIKVCSLKAWEAKGYEGKLVKSVVQTVLIELKKKFELVTPENLVGIDSHVEKVMKFVDNNSSATLLVGIHGMGGIGKTTLAKTIYNKLSNQFEYRSFIADIRELCERKGLEYLQNQLIFAILKQKDQVYNTDEGISLLSSKFKGKKVLIIFDDVDDDDQLKALVGNHNWFCSGSVIIITTRNEDILDKANVDYKHEHEELDKSKSLILFSRHAFRRDAPPSEFEELTDEVLSTAGGLPLSLEVLGSLFCGKKATQWGGTIEKLTKVPLKKVQEKLRISYETLENGQKQIFLDIACFFIGTDERIASYMWKACNFFPEEGIEVLRLKSLIKVGEDHRLKMHDQLRDLGRWIVCEENENEPWYRSRLWDSEEALTVLKEDEGTEKIEAISLATIRRGGIGIISVQLIKKLRNLRFLEARGADFRGDFEDSFKKLKWLQWQSCPMTLEANNFHLKELVVLDMSCSDISDEWQGWSSIKMATKLKYLDLTFCKRLKGLPKELGKLRALVELCLENSGIRQLPDSIRALQNLEILNISRTKIKELPDSIGELSKLRVLNASCCGQLGGELPKSIRNLSSLQFLYLDYCEELQSLPVLPSSLTHLGVGCRSQRLTSLSNLTHLKVLRLYSCPSLENFWEHPSTPSEKSLNTPFELDILEICSCRLLKTLDVSLFSHLRTLSVEFCTRILEIRGLDNLKYLESLEIVDCDSIERLDPLKSKGLKKLIAQECKKLVAIQGVDWSESLEEIDISGCASIERLDLPKSKGLKKLIARDCKKLVAIQGIDWSESLEEIDISWCASIERLDLPKSKGLKKLIARDCKKLVAIQGIDWSESLEEIDISCCTSIERLDLPKSMDLKIFNAERCNNLVEIQGLDGLECLEDIDISSCASIERLDLPKSKGLKKLIARNCKKLVAIQGVDWSESLEEIDISWCDSIERLDLSKFKGLNIFKARFCKNLIDIQGLDRLESLEELDISWCRSIERLDLPKSKGLKIFNATRCNKLVEIQGLDGLESLEEIDISSFTSIERLDLSKSKGFKRLSWMLQRLISKTY